MPNDDQREPNGSSSWTGVNIHVVRFDTSFRMKIYCCCLSSKMKTKMKHENNIWCFSEDVKRGDKLRWAQIKTPVNANAANGTATLCVSFRGVFLLWKLEPTVMPDFEHDFSRRPVGGDGSAWLRRRQLAFISFDLRHRSWAPDLSVASTRSFSESLLVPGPTPAAYLTELYEMGRRYKNIIRIISRLWWFRCKQGGHVWGRYAQVSW